MASAHKKDMKVFLLYPATLPFTSPEEDEQLLEQHSFPTRVSSSMNGEDFFRSYASIISVSQCPSR